MLLKQEDFKYPTTEEILTIKDLISDISSFKFKRINTFQKFFAGELSLEQSHRINNLHHWDVCLSNRFGKLLQTFNNALTYYNRGVSEDFNANHSPILVNTFLFEYHAEIFYYFLFSSLDIVAQIISFYYDPLSNEKKVSFNFEFAKKYSFNISILLETFNRLEDARECRNSFAHRFTPLMNDSRSSFDNEENGAILGVSYEKRYDYNFILKNIQESLDLLSSLMNNLKQYLKSDTENNTFLFD
jgi:hypothetical protein